MTHVLLYPLSVERTHSFVKAYEVNNMHFRRCLDMQ